MRKYFLTLPLALSLVMITTPAYAYFDPNASSLLFQVLAPLTAAVTSIWLLGMEKIRTLITAVKQKLSFRKTRAEVECGAKSETITQDAEQD